MRTERDATGPPERLKRGFAFALLRSSGEVAAEDAAAGIYYRDTRVADRYRVRASAGALRVESSENLDDRLLVRLRLATAHGEWRFERDMRLTERALVDRWRYQAPDGASPLRLRFEIDSAFRDIFEVRGLRRRRRGRLERGDGGRLCAYRGRDGRSYRLALHGRRLAPQGRGALVVLAPGPRGRAGSFTLRLSWQAGTHASRPAARRAQAGIGLPALVSGDDAWDAVWQRACRDLAMLGADFGHGTVPMAGLPWFGSLFGRDAITTALLTLPLAPEMARATVETLAALQGRRVDPWREEAPGKILHEMRLGEMARTGEVPFGRYYGAVDGTALFVTLLVRTWRTLGDDAWLADNEGALRAALAWIEANGRQDTRLGLYRFAPSAPGGLAVQSWKDSADSMVHADGSQARPPVAVAEVQGYVFQALRGAAVAVGALGDRSAARRLRDEAAQLQRRFQAAFWLDARRGYAMAVDGDDRPLAVASSDAGQCLWSGIVPAPYRRATAARLMQPDMFSGWGLRTLSAGEAAYDALSYHRGSVWPHDTALAAAGMLRAGERTAGERLGRALVEAGAALPGHRLPELFSGAARVPGQAPAPYATACQPQAWAAAAPLGMLIAMLGLRIDARRRLVRAGGSLGAGLRAVTVGPIRVPDGEIVLRVDPNGASLDAAPRGWRLGAAASAGPAVPGAARTPSLDSP